MYEHDECILKHDTYHFFIRMNTPPCAEIGTNSWGRSKTNLLCQLQYGVH